MRASPPDPAMTRFISELNRGGPTREVGSKSHSSLPKMAG